MKYFPDQITQHPFVVARPGLRQFVKFSIVGVVNTIASASVYTFGTRILKLDPLVANGLAFVVAVTISFFLNKRWTFRDRRQASVGQYSKFFTVAIIGFGLSEIIILWLHHILQVHDLIAFAIATVVVLFWNFGVNRWWTFRHAALSNAPTDPIIPNQDH